MKDQKETTIIDIAISEIEKQKFSLHKSKVSAVKVGLTDALGVLHYLKEESFIECECDHVVEHKYSFTNDDVQVTCVLCMKEYLENELGRIITNLIQITPEKILSIIQENYNSFHGTNEAEICSANDIFDMIYKTYKDEETR